MVVKLEIPQRAYQHLLNHLNPHKDNVEQAAFLFCDVAINGERSVFSFKDMYVATSHDFEIHSAYHIELKDEVKGKVIRQAHNLGASMVEVHSHVDQRSAKFSYSDWSGFSEFVPHVMWRLKGKPYIALVYAANSFDALVWIGDSKIPVELSEISVGGKKFIPTNNSIIDFKNKKHESFW
jgi:hypothetical protein